MSIFTWGAQPKSQVDPETVEEAITRIVAQHEHDPASHLGENESIEAHRSSEIIDHLAESILNDKLELPARAYTAIVDISGNGDFTDIQSGINHCINNGGGNVLVRRGNYIQSADIQMSKYVDLIGEGVRESTIDFNGGDYCIRGYKRLSYGPIYSDSVGATSGSKIITFPVGSNLLSSGLYSAGMYFHDYTNDIWYLIDSINSNTQITIHTNYSNATATIEGEIILAGTVTNGSPIITFPAGVNLLNLPIFLEMYILSDTFEYSAGDVLSIDSATQLTMTTNSEETTGLFGLYFTEVMPTNNLIKDISIISSIADYAFESDSNGPGFNIYNVSVDFCLGVIKSFNRDLSLGYITRLSFSNCQNVPLFWLRDYEVSFVSGYVNTNNNKLFKLESSMNLKNVLHDVHVELGNHTGNVLFQFYFCQVIMYQCFFNQFDYFCDFTGTGDTYADYNSIMNCSFTSNKASYMDLPLAYTQFHNNSLSAYKGYGFRFPAVSFKNIITNNISQYTLVNSGTNNVLANNINY